ncbi:MAG: hypothetical protein K0S74_369 [Chlamydiales bacterium]|jgi:hypothetical protein|nr:hypothetical protein [Chlamydiales bacterium]
METPNLCTSSLQSLPILAVNYPFIQDLPAEGYRKICSYINPLNLNPHLHITLQFLRLSQEGASQIGSSINEIFHEKLIQICSPLLSLKFSGYKILGQQKVCVIYETTPLYLSLVDYASHAVQQAASLYAQSLGPPLQTVVYKSGPSSTEYGMIDESLLYSLCLRSPLPHIALGKLPKNVQPNKFIKQLYDQFPTLPNLVIYPSNFKAQQTRVNYSP